MQSPLETEHIALRNNIISIDRPDSSQLVDLHVYILPKHIWKNLQNLVENEAMEQAISAGFVHVPQNLNLHELRQYILTVCGQDETFPKEFIYLRSVGRCLTKVKPQQESELRVKNYRPPMTFAPEIYVIEGRHDDEHVQSASSKTYLYRESPIQRALGTPQQLITSRQQSWTKPTSIPPLPSATKLRHLSVQSEERKKSTSTQVLPVISPSNLSTSFITLSARDLAKLREEQERLRLRQIELARQRREIEQEQERRHKELLEKQEQEKRQRELLEKQEQEKRRKELLEKQDQERIRRESFAQGEKLSRDRQREEDQAAIQIQRAYRKYRNRRKTEEQQWQQREKPNFVDSRGLWSPEPEERQIRSSSKQGDTYSISLEGIQTSQNERQASATSSTKSENSSTKKTDANQSFGFSSFRQASHELERLQKEARELARRKAEKEHAEELSAPDVVKLTDHLEELKAERMALETTRETIIRQMQQLHAQIAGHRKEERDLWKQKYLFEKKKTAALEERGRMTLQDQLDLNTQLEQAKLRLNNVAKLRQQAENECRLLRQELDQSRSHMNSLENVPTSKQPAGSQDKQHVIPITVDITLQY